MRGEPPRFQAPNEQLVVELQGRVLFWDPVQVVDQERVQGHGLACFGFAHLPAEHRVRHRPAEGPLTSIGQS